MSGNGWSWLFLGTCVCLRQCAWADSGLLAVFSSKLPFSRRQPQAQQAAGGRPWGGLQCRPLCQFKPLRCPAWTVLPTGTRPISLASSCPRPLVSLWTSSGQPPHNRTRTNPPSTPATVKLPTATHTNLRAAHDKQFKSLRPPQYVGRCRCTAVRAVVSPHHASRCTHGRSYLILLIHRLLSLLRSSLSSHVAVLSPH